MPLLETHWSTWWAALILLLPMSRCLPGWEVFWHFCKGGGGKKARMVAANHISFRSDCFRHCKNPLLLCWAMPDSQGITGFYFKHRWFPSNSAFNWHLEKGGDSLPPKLWHYNLTGPAQIFQACLLNWNWCNISMVFPYKHRQAQTLTRDTVLLQDKLFNQANRGNMMQRPQQMFYLGHRKTYEYGWLHKEPCIKSWKM